MQIQRMERNDISTDQNIVATPKISGFEFINFNIDYKTAIDKAIMDEYNFRF